MVNESPTTSRQRITARQLKFIEYLVWKSRDADEFTRKCLIYLIRESEGLTREVKIVTPKIYDLVSKGFHDMGSCNCTTHIDAVLGISGSPMVLNGMSLVFSYRTDYSGILKLKPTIAVIEAIVPTSPYSC